ncbi:MAG: sulfatase-like hydrolase/transferase [Polyangiaceae bacterium]|nr:sulfatase-like hydrolase/transferase [Polyangiaceae bacterium]
MADTPKDAEKAADLENSDSDNESAANESTPAASERGKAPPQNGSDAADKPPTKASEKAKKAPFKPGPAHLRRKSLRRKRRLFGFVTLLLPVLWIVGWDLARRFYQIRTFDRPHLYGYLGSIAESAVVWGIILHTVSRRRGLLQAILLPIFVFLYATATGVQAAFNAFWNVYLSIDGLVHSKSIAWSIVGTLPLSKPIVFIHFLIAIAAAVGIAVLARKVVRPTKWGRRVVPFFLPAAFIAPTQIPVSYRKIQSTPPDLIYFHGMTALVKEHLGYTNDSPDLRVQRRDPESVPTFKAQPARPRNVVLLLQESMRADVTCVEYDPDCALATPFSNKVVPDRYPFVEMRAHDSTTAISISNIWSGVRPTETREVLHSVPLIWDYADAAGYDTAYWTSQNLMFGNARLYIQDIPVSQFAVGTNLDREAPLDEGALDSLLTDRVIADWDQLREPFFAVVHYSNCHFPYVYDPNHAPFQPADFNKAAESNESYRNYYKDVVYLSDMAVARLITHIRSTEKGDRTVLVYTSDHGESFREHWQLGHTSSLYDEEIQVPGWIDAPEGTLSPEEAASLKKAKNEYVWHLDLAPTFLDLMGIWNDPNLAPYRARMMGHPLTRPERTIEPVPLTNCTWVWECSFRNWGLMQGPMKIEAREWDGEFHCFNVAEDPLELNNLGEGPCTPMPELARQMYHSMPNITPPGRPVVNWGK